MREGTTGRVLHMPNGNEVCLHIVDHISDFLLSKKTSGIKKIIACHSNEYDSVLYEGRRINCKYRQTNISPVHCVPVAVMNISAGLLKDKFRVDPKVRIFDYATTKLKF